jgi:hypothetical protein
MPAYDGTPRVRYGILRPEADAIFVEHRPLDYDRQSASAKRRRIGLPAGYCEALATGFWPSCDVLPIVDRHRRGQPLDAPTHCCRFTTPQHSLNRSASGIGVSCTASTESITDRVPLLPPLKA